MLPCPCFRCESSTLPRATNMPRSPRQDDERYGSRSREYDDYKADGGGRRKDRGGADEDDRRRRDERRSAREHEDDYDRRDDRRRRRVYDDDEDEEEERRRRKRRERERERDGEGSKRRRFRSPEGGDYASRRGEGSSRRHEEERRRDDGRRSREPPQGGDGGWGPRAEGSSNARAVVRGASPGRPSRALPSQQDALRAQNGEQGGEVAERPAAVKVEPNFKNSGMLAAETNTFKGVVLKCTSTELSPDLAVSKAEDGTLERTDNEPPEARKPLKPWRLYVFKGKEQVGACTV